MRASRLSLRSHTAKLAAIFAAGLAVRVALTPLYAHLPNGLLDEGFWKHWMERIHEHGVLNIFRTSDTDYVGYHWVLWLLAIVYDRVGGPYTQTTLSLHILVKFPSIVFDLALMAAVYSVTRLAVAGDGDGGARLPRDAALAAAALAAFHPAILYDSAVWAQTDSAIAAAMLGSLALAYRGHPRWAGVVYALGFAIKPHPIIIAPLLLLALWRWGRGRAVVEATTAAAVTLGLILAPWVIHGDARRIGHVYNTLFRQQRERLSELAWNIWWIPDQLGDPRPGSAAFGLFGALTYERLALGLSAAATLLALGFALRNRDFVSLLIAAAFESFAFYELPIGSHERYLYPLLVLLLPVLFVRPRWLLIYAPISVTFFLNLVVVAPPIGRYEGRYVYGDIGVTVAAVQALLFAAFAATLLWRTARPAPAPVRDTRLRTSGELAA